MIDADERHKRQKGQGNSNEQWFAINARKLEHSQILNYRALVEIIYIFATAICDLSKYQ